MRVGFIGLGNVGAKLAGSLLRNGHDLWVHDLNDEFVADFVSRGATDGGSPANLMKECEAVITCLPSPAACDAVVSQMIPEIVPGKIWMEMSTTDATEVERLGALVVERVARPSNARFPAAAIGPQRVTSVSLRVANGRHLKRFCLF